MTDELAEVYLLMVAETEFKHGSLASGPCSQPLFSTLSIIQTHKNAYKHIT